MIDNEGQVNYMLMPNNVCGTTTTSTDCFNGANKAPKNVHISIVICHNGEYDNKLHNCLLSIYVSRLLTLCTTELIIISNKRMPQKMFDQEITNVIVDAGLAEARNIGARIAHGDIVAYIDSDAIVSEKWIDDIVTAFNVHGFDACGGPVKPLKDIEVPDRLIGCTSNDTVLPIGCNVAFKRNVLLDNPFREDLGKMKGSGMVAEETELIYRIIKKGYKVMYINEAAIVYHDVGYSRTTLSYLIHRSWYEGFSKACAGIVGKRERSMFRKLIRYHTSPSWYIRGLMVLMMAIAGYAIGRMCCLCGRT